MEQQMKQMTIQRRHGVCLKQLHAQIQELNVSDFGMLEDAYYDAPDKPVRGIHDYL